MVKTKGLNIWDNKTNGDLFMNNQNLKLYRKVSRMIVGPLIAASLIFACRKPSSEHIAICKYRDGSVEFTIWGTEADLPRDAKHIKSLKDLEDKTFQVFFRLPDPENKFRTIPLEEFRAQRRSGKRNDTELPNCEEWEARGDRL